MFCCKRDRRLNHGLDKTDRPNADGKKNIERESVSNLGEILADKWLDGFTIVHSIPKWWKKRFPDAEYGFDYLGLDNTFENTFDHPVWLKDKETGAIVLMTQPYMLMLNIFCISMLEKWCNEHKLTCHISAMSEHFPSRTIVLIFRPVI